MRITLVQAGEVMGLLGKTFQNIRYKYRLLISLMLVFLVPSVFISSVFIPKIRDEEKKSYMETSKQLFGQVAYNIGTVFEGIQKLSYQFLGDQNLKSVNRKLLVTEKMNACDTIRNYMLTNDYVSELAFYSEDEDKIYFSGGTADVDLYFGSLYQYEDWKTADFYRTFHELVYPIGMVKHITPMGNPSQEMVVIMSPLSNCAFQAVIFQVQMNQVLKFVNELHWNEEDIWDLYFNGEMIYSSGEAQALQRILELEELEVGTGAISTRAKGKEMTLLYTPEDSLLQVVLHRDLSQARLSVSSISFLYMLALMGFLGIGSVAILFIWRGNYRPVKEMLTYLPTGECEHADEFDLVKNTLLSIQTEKEKIEQNFMDSISAYRKQFLTSLIKGEYESMEEFNRKAKETGICLAGTHVVILALSIVDADHPTNIRKTAILEQILAQSERQMPEGIQCYGFVDMMNEKIIYIASTDLEGEEKIGDSLIAFQRRMQEGVGFELNIGCSEIYAADSAMLSKAYMEALSALDYRIVYGNGKIIYFSQISLNNYSHNWYPEKLARKFRIALKNKDEDQVHIILDEIMEHLHHNNTPVYVAKYVCYDLMQMLADSLTVAKSLPYKKTIGYHNIINIARVSSFEQITEILHQNVSYVLSMDVKTEHENVNQELKQKIEQYIEENYSDCNFSMTSLVEAFGVSESTMRKNFKTLMENTFIEYLAMKRINKSKELLSDTELPLGEIASRVGYQDTSSFIRRFRQKTGMPPGEYRLLYAGQHKNEI